MVLPELGQFGQFHPIWGKAHGKGQDMQKAAHAIMENDSGRFALVVPFTVKPFRSDMECALVAIRAICPIPRSEDEWDDSNGADIVDIHIQDALPDLISPFEDIRRGS